VGARTSPRLFGGGTVTEGEESLTYYATRLYKKAVFVMIARVL